jgi:PAS domain S-box-containing protein
MATLKLENVRVLSRLTRYWTDLPLRGKGLVVVTIPVVALAMGSISTIMVERQQHNADEWVAHTLLVRNVAGQVLRDQTDAAASVRGYLLTGDTAYLTPARLTEQESPTVITQLETLVRDNPAQLERARRIEDLAQQHMSNLAELQARQPDPSGVPDANDAARLETDQATLNSLRDEVNALLDEEELLLDQRTSHANQISNAGSILAALNLTIGLAGSLFAVVLFTTGIVRRVQRLEGQTSRVETGQPLLPASSSTDELGRFERSLATAAALLHDQQYALQTANERLQQELAERERADETIAQLNRRNELILNAAGDGIVGTDDAGRTIFVNPAAARLLGYRPQELIGAPSPLEGPVAAALDGVIRHVADEEFVHRDGTRFPVEYISTPIREKGTIVGAVVTFKDITERQAVERMKTEFVSTVSHELRTPLTSIRGSLGLLSGGVFGPLPPEGDRMLTIAVNNTDRLIRLINDILDIERLESGEIGLSRQMCDVSELLDQALNAIRGVAEQAGITLSVSATPSRLQADPDRLVQTLTNLLGNAVKFSPRGSTVWLRVARVNHDLLFSVQDQGRGIPREKVVSIFERFRQVDASDSRKKGGTGLGLAICRSIVQQHGGRIWAESEGEGLGSTFFFTLPAPNTDRNAPAMLVTTGATQGDGADTGSRYETGGE